MSRTMLGTIIVVLVLAVLVLATAAAEPPTSTARMRFFDCAVVQFFGEACTPDTEITLASPRSGPEAVVPTPMLPPTESLLPLSSATPVDAAVPQESLFTPETVSPDTPPLLLRLLQDPTETNARTFLVWYQARLARIQQVQTLLDTLSATVTGTSTLPVSLDQSAPKQAGERP